jgi:general secretion pathway protein A
MYSHFFGLRTNPFLPLSDPATILRTSQVQETLQHLLHARQNHHGIFLLTGEVGTGKTTAMQAAVAELPAKTPVVFLPPTLSSWGELLDELCQALSPGGARGSKAEKRRRLESCLAVHAAEGNKAFVIVDEAHLLPDTILEHLRLLTNVREGRHPVVHICLIGQPELAMRLRSDPLRQLRQRITLRYTMMPLSLEETELYLIERLRAAGAGNSDAIFDAGAVRALYAMTGGIPREINVVADQAMTNAFVSNVSHVSRAHLRSVAGDFGFEGVFLEPGRNTTLALPRNAPEPVPAIRESSSLPEPQVQSPTAAESTLSLEEPRLRKGPGAHTGSVYRTARSFRAAPAAATLFVLAFAVVGVLSLLSVNELPTESARTTPPVAARPPGMTSPTSPAANAPPVEAARKPRNVADEGEADSAIDDESHAAVSTTESLEEPLSSPPSADRSGIEERYPSTLEVDSGVPVVVWLGEERLGTAPGSFSRVPPGRYQVRLELADGRSFSKDVIVTPGSTTYVRARWPEP